MAWKVPSVFWVCAAAWTGVLLGGARVTAAQPAVSAGLEDEAELLSPDEVATSLVERLHALEDRQSLHDAAALARPPQVPAALAVAAPLGSEPPASAAKDAR